MKDLDNQHCNVWNEMSFRRFKNRKNEIEDDIFKIEENNFLSIYDYDYYFYNNSYGLYENINLDNCFGIEDYWEITEEFN